MREIPQGSRWPYFIMGALFYLGAQMAYQDALGLDGYMAALNAGWQDTPVWLGVLIAVLALGGMVIEAPAWLKRDGCVACALMEELERRHGFDEVIAATKAGDGGVYLEVHNALGDIVQQAVEDNVI